MASTQFMSTQYMPFCGLRQTYNRPKVVPIAHPENSAGSYQKNNRMQTGIEFPKQPKQKKKKKKTTKKKKNKAKKKQWNQPTNPIYLLPN